MPYKIDTVNGHLDLLHTLISFAGGWPDHTGVTSTITGNAQLKYVRSLALTTPLETWTLVCTTAGGDGVAVFSVTGSISGVQASVTAGIDYSNAFCRLKITGPALYNCVLGDQYVFTFIAGLMTTAATAWTIERYVNAYTSTAESILNAPGGAPENILVGLKAQEDVGGDIYNLGLQGYTAYSASDLWEEQPGAIPMRGFNGVVSTADYWCPMIAFSKEPSEGRLYLSVNGRRMQGCVFFEGYSAPFYLGWLLPYFTPLQWPYPMMVGGSCGSETLMRYSNTNFYNSSWFFPLVADNQNIAQANGMSPCRVLDPGLGWQGLKNWYSRAFSDEQVSNVSGGLTGYTWPYASRLFEDVQKNIDGSYPLFPIYLFSKQDTQDSNDGYIFGVPEGCFAISGFDNTQENDFTIGGDLYIVVRNSQYSSVWDYMAMRMDS